MRAGGEDSEQVLMRCSRAEVSGPESLWLMVDVNAVFAGPWSSPGLSPDIWEWEEACSAGGEGWGLK